MKIINFGSLNIDRVYQVDHLVRPGETITSLDYKEFAGGKGLNQSIALARAGGTVFHAGKIGSDGTVLTNYLRDNGVDVSLVYEGEDLTGHAIIQVDGQGENAIVLFAGANRSLAEEEVTDVISKAEKGDYLLLQNEINRIEEIIEKGAEKGVHIVFNPAPITPEILSLSLEGVEWLIVNETEGSALSGRTEPSQIVASLLDKYPALSVVLTLGSSGVIYGDAANSYFVEAETVTPVDTTAAGDTFIGYFIADIVKGASIEAALKTASQAAAITVTRPGAAESIPFSSELS